MVPLLQLVAGPKGLVCFTRV